MSRYDWMIDSAKRYNIKPVEGYSTRLFKYCQGYFDWGYEWGQKDGYKRCYDLFLAVYPSKSNQKEVLYKLFKRVLVCADMTLIPADMKVLAPFVANVSYTGNPNNMEYVEIEGAGYVKASYKYDRTNSLYEISESEWDTLLSYRASSVMLLEKHPELIQPIEGFDIVNSLSIAYDKAKEVIELFSDILSADYYRSNSITQRDKYIAELKEKRQELSVSQDELLRAQEEGMEAMNELEEKWGIKVEV